jgi:N-acetylmuramoyl-L-alanine amidase
LLALAAAVTAIAEQAPATQAASPLTVISREGRRTLPVVRAGDREMVALADLIPIFDLVVREDRLADGLTVSYRDRSIIMTPGQGLASVGGRLVSLPAGPVRHDRTWLVPIEFIDRALGLVHEARIDLRRASRLVIVGDLRVPRITARHERLGEQARVTFQMTPPVPHSVVKEPDRLIVKFEADALDIVLPDAESSDLVGAIRLVDPQTSVAIELGPGFEAFRASDLPAEGTSARLVVDLLPAMETAAAPEPRATPLEPLPLFDLSPVSAIRTIVIDPGHGGEEPGARGPGGTLEKDVTLAVARRLKAAIEGRLGMHVLLTRDWDQTVRLDQRAALANNNKADLFISLHANASFHASIRGAEVYYLSLDEYGEAARRRATSGPQVLPVLGGGTRQIEVVRWDMAQARHVSNSAMLARLMEGRLRERVEMSPRALQQAPLRVLLGANMPAVLVEMGFLSNPEQERQLASDAYQNAVAQALFDGIVRFRDYMAAGPRARTTSSDAPGGDQIQPVGPSDQEDR